MSTNSPTPELNAQNNSQDQAQPTFTIQRVYLKDVSLEQPNSPMIFLENEAPNVDLQINIGAEMLAQEVYESTLVITLTAKLKDKVDFLVEAKQAGIFELNHIPQEHVDPIMGITAPSILYPYLRANVADMITRAGFPPIHLQEINFEHLYQQRLAAMAQQKDEHAATH